MTDVYFYIGRLSYLIVYFDPIVDSPLMTPAKPKFAEIDPIEFLLNQQPIKLQKGITVSNEAASIMSIIYDLPVSFLNNSIGISSPNSTVCLGNISALNTSFALLITQFNMSLYDKMGTTLKSMIKAVDPISFACFYSGFEYYAIFLDYVYTIIDVNKLVYNIFHNAGGIYDSITDIIDNFRYNNPAIRSYWQRIGGNIGYIVNQISYKPTNYEPYKPKI